MQSTQDFNDRPDLSNLEAESKRILQLGTEIRMDLEQINSLAGKLNTQFGQTRERIGEIETSLRDVEPYLLCCILSDQCNLYYEKRPSDDGGRWTAPRVGGASGDPHLSTLDGLG